MKKTLLGMMLGLSMISVVSAADKAELAVNEQENCNNFSELLTSTSNLLDSVSSLATSCPNFVDQIVEVAVSIAPATEHQQIMQVVSDSGLLDPADILLAAIAGGGDPASLSEPTAAGNLSITPASAAATPSIIGGRNGGVIASDN